MGRLKALAAAEHWVGSDRDGLLALFDAVDRLGDDPRPAAAFSWGGSRYRLAVGRFRVIYEVVDAEVTIEVIHLGRAV